MKKRLGEFVHEEGRGVSEVLDTVLLVSIVVILAAIGGVFALGLSDAVAQDTPQASIGVADHVDAYSASPGTGIFTMSHTSGDDLAAADTRIVIRNVSNQEYVADLHAGNSFNDSSTNVTLNDATTSFDGQTFQTGDVIRLNVDQPGDQVFSSGTKYEVLVIDTESDQLVASRTVRLS